ncbi:MAG: hypothetical protein ACREKE_09185 [bacterium]
MIAYRTVGDPALWPLLVTDNRGRLADPGRIYVGDTLNYRTSYTVAEIAAAVKTAAAATAGEAHKVLPYR